ncbi:MAG: acyl--CoA ligase [Polyangiaceae bacterium]|nr:acyl--CoA ligase [Polyangiaceae bacterium]
MSQHQGTETLLHGLLLEAAVRHADRVAFVHRTRSVTYAELDRDAGRLAASLRDLGIGAGDRVLLALDGVPEYLVGYHAILRAGAVVVPHNPDTRPALIRRAIEHTGCRAAIVEQKTVGLLEPNPPAGLEQVIAVPDLGPQLPTRLAASSWQGLVARTDRLDHGGAGGSDLATIVTTSGTTGRPKGVMLSHENLLANTRSIVEYLELSSDDVAGMVLPFYYVYGASVIHSHVAVGGTVAMVGSLTFPAAVLSGIARHRCTGLPGVPSTFARLVQLDLASFDLSSLRYLTQAGGPMTPALTERVRAAFPRARLFVMYGQTEATARLTYLPPERLTEKLGSVGVPIPGVNLEILGPDRQRLPPGERGELVARGKNVMLGYWQDPELTATVLSDGRLFTGDLGWQDDDGFFFITGRQSDMIKSGAHRIAPQEVEEVLATLPGLVECAVVGVPDELLGEAIVAYLVLAPGTVLTGDAVITHAVEQLPRFKIPTRVFAVADLPRTATGKVRRAALRDWFAEGHGQPLARPD